MDQLSQDVAWLIEIADEVLASITEQDPLKLASRLRKSFTPTQTSLLCELAELRKRATAKFARSGKMFFTRLGYEQSSSQCIAQYKARRFAGLHRVADLCSGIGGDAIALHSAVDQLTLVDRSPAMTRLAAANLHVHDAIGTAVLCDDVRDVNLAECDAWHLDPDRRPDARRRSTPDLCDPPLDQFLEIVEDRPHGAVKLSPAADATYLLDQGAELEWIGCRGECQQQVAWFGDLAQAPGARTAAWLTVNQHHDITDVDRLIERKDSAPTIATTSSHQFLYEPRPSVLAAQLEDSLAMEFGMRKLASNLPILTSELAAKSNLFRRFRVVEILPFRKQPLREAIHRHGFCVTEVKKRGVDVSPENLLRELTRPQGSPCVVYLYPLAKAIQAAIVIRDDIRR